MAQKAILMLEDGSVYEGLSFGAENFTYGEVVFNTSMTGYQEMLTDPSYAGQILVCTYPISGNYGINDFDSESRRIQVRSFVVREECHQPNHWQSKSTLHQFLEKNNISGICGVDTRAITRRLRSSGVMMGAIACALSPAEVMEKLKDSPRYDNIDFVKEVSTEKLFEWEPEGGTEATGPHIVVLDCGTKFNIMRILRYLGCRVTAVPCNYSAQQILDLKPGGILLSPGPGDPALLGYIVKNVKELAGVKPMMGICLGEQLVARAFGAETFKLKFGHRGGNHPVKDLESGRVHITAQNHGYAVDANSLKKGLEVSHINLNDRTVEGLRHCELPILGIQYHSEASPGPLDNLYVFEKFLEMVSAN